MSATSSLGRRAALAFAAVPALLTRPAAAATDKVTVVTGLQVTYSIARALAKDTTIDVYPAFPPDTGMDEQAPYLAKRRRADFIAAARIADAAITIRRVWDLDPLYPAVRAQNIRVIEIDASTPFAPEMAGVALLETARTGAGETQIKTASPYIWLNLTNVVRMTDIVAADLRRLSEADSKTIDRNQKAFRGAILAMRAAAEARIGEVDNPDVILLNGDLGYFVSDMGVNIAGRIAKSAYDWNDADVKALLALMEKTGTKAVVAASMPKDSIVAAIKGAGGRIAVLNLLDPGLSDADGRLDPDGLLKAARANLDSLVAALQS